MDNIGAIRLFALVVDFGTFSATARHLQVSTASVSRQIGALEDRLKVRLLNRGLRELTLTEAGELLLRRARPLIHELDGAFEDIALLHARPRGLLKICARTIAAEWLITGLPRFLAENPDVTVELLISNDEDMDLVAHNIDVDIRYSRPDRTDLIARLLAPSELVMLANPAYLEARGTPATVADLEDHDILQFTWQADSPRWVFRDPEGRSREFDPAGRLRLNDGMALRAALRTGLGIAMMPRAEVQGELAAGTLVPVLPDHGVVFPRVGGEGIFAVYQRSPYPTGKVRSFLAFLQSIFG